jgi:hypothetical protein
MSKVLWNVNALESSIREGCYLLAEVGDRFMSNRMFFFIFWSVSRFFCLFGNGYCETCFQDLWLLPINMIIWYQLSASSWIWGAVIIWFIWCWIGNFFFWKRFWNKFLESVTGLNCKKYSFRNIWSTRKAREM